jgi:hypothetical protein
VETYVLFALYGLAASVLIGWVFKQLWGQHDQRTIQEKWEEREHLLDPPGTRATILDQRARPVGPRDRDSQRRLQIVEPEPFARVLFIVARDQRALVKFLHNDLAAEEAEGLIEIRLDRRQSPTWQDAQPREAEGRRDPHRNRAITTSLRETGWAFARQPVPPAATARSLTASPDPVALGKYVSNARGRLR